MDPYVYPGTNVLRILRGIRDENLLGEFEADVTSRRIRQLEHRAMAGYFNCPHLQSIHRYIFQDVFEWAGEFRTVDIGKGGDLFARPEYIATCLEAAFEELAKERYLASADLKRFAKRGAYYLGEINAVHPFREGNGRTQREFIRQLAARNGYTIDWWQVSREQMMDASRQSFSRDEAGLEAVLMAALNNGPNRRRSSPT
jgi:cell filamentation protein